MSLPSRSKQDAISLAQLGTVLSYDQITGIFLWCSTGASAGTLHRNGYIRITIRRKPYFAHRLAWLYVYGQWPASYLDHINGDRTDNRIANLREANTTQNSANRRPRYTRRPKGITHHRGRWQAQIRHNGKNLYLGLFETAEQAAAVYAKKAREIHGEFRWVG